MRKEQRQKRIRLCQSARMWMIILAAGLLLAGYTLDRLPVLYACVLPLAIAAGLTYLIKYLERGREDDDELL